MVVLGGLVTLTAHVPDGRQPSASRGPRVGHRRRGVGAALVVITRNVDLSVEATIGLVAIPWRAFFERHALDTPGAIAFGRGLGLRPRDDHGSSSRSSRRPAIVATLGTLSIFRGNRLLVAGSHQVPLAGLPPGFTDPAGGLSLRDFHLRLIAVVIVIVAASSSA